MIDKVMIISYRIALVRRLSFVFAVVVVVVSTGILDQQFSI